MRVRVCAVCIEIDPFTARRHDEIAFAKERKSGAVIKYCQWSDTANAPLYFFGFFHSIWEFNFAFCGTSNKVSTLGRLLYVISYLKEKLSFDHR